MKIKNIENIDKFFEVVDSCSGKVELVGDDLRLNLKSKLTQYVSIAKIFADGIVPELELVVQDPDDQVKFVKFMMGE